MKAAKRCLQYLKGTRDLGLTYGRPDSSDRMMVYALESSKDLKDRIVGFIDIDFDSNPYDRKSVADYILYFMGSPITWKSKKMQMTCLSTMESELVAMTEATTQIMNVRHLLTDLLFPPEGPSVLKCDNQAVSPLNTHAKHIDYRKFFMKEKYSDGIIYPDYIRTHENVVDLLTKSLPRPQFEYLRSFILGSNHHLQEFHYEIDHNNSAFETSSDGSIDQNHTPIWIQSPNNLVVSPRGSINHRYKEQDGQNTRTSES
eukprot:CAMPEP_0184307182 /NCGR_PEP_ID=MMETSP1049-20130417/15996_1 /TAXON_ID=77928 /ORGANISM="Proteomonas sulcata, Strain CCMP704" /LENGTH=257 /DNA_ID=CAMNT_0026619617 /DNA_START=785 /DNA_END=1560 /DNA_ORIENTATION=-